MSNLVSFNYTFPKEDCLVGKHLFIANMSMLKAFKVIMEIEKVFVYVRTPKYEWIQKLVNDFGFILIGDEVFDREFDHYIYSGTGVHRIAVNKGEHRPFMSIKRALPPLRRMAKTGTSYKGYSCRWYVKVLEHLKTKEVVYNTVIDPLFDSTIKEFHQLYFCNYLTKNGIINEAFAEEFRKQYFRYVSHFYQKYAYNPKGTVINDVYANFNNVNRFNGKRKKAIFTAISKGLNVNHLQKNMVHSINDYMDKVGKYHYTLATYSYDKNTMSVLRMLDALAVGTIPLVAVSHDDLCKWLSPEIADFYRDKGLNVLEKDFDFEKVKKYNGLQRIIIRQKLTDLIADSW